MSVYSFITQPFRFSTQTDPSIRVAYDLARQVEIDASLSNLADAAAVALELFNILKSPRQRFDVPVIGVNIITVDMFDGQVPCATLLSDRWGLTAGKLVAIPDFTIDLAAGQTVLRCWG